jgi:tripartite motif-containing protein 33
MEQLIKDVRLMFKNAYTYNPEDSQVYADAKTLEKFFDEQLEKFLPEYAYEHFDDDDIQPPSKKYRRIISD